MIDKRSLKSCSSCCAFCSVGYYSEKVRQYEGKSPFPFHNNALTIIEPNSNHISQTKWNAGNKIACFMKQLKVEINACAKRKKHKFNHQHERVSKTQCSTRKGEKTSMKHIRQKHKHAVMCGKLRITTNLPLLSYCLILWLFGRLEVFPLRIRWIISMISQQKWPDLYSSLLILGRITY